LDLTCEPEWKIAFIVSAFFAGCFIGNFFLPRLADVYGRKKLFLASGGITFALMQVILFTKSLNTMIAVHFLVGLISSVKYCVGYNYLIELAPKRL